MVTVRGAWLRWKMLRLPWRKKFFVGQDLQGNTFWEAKDPLNHNRYRRSVLAGREVHYSDVHVSPQWHQWLRHTRPSAPTIQEQIADVQRQDELKHNARLADERWAAKAKYIEKPKRTVNDDGQRQIGQGAANLGRGPVAPAESDQQQETAVNPGSNWQPEAWTPGPSRQRQ